MTTFSFSVRIAPDGDEWQKQFTNESLSELLVDFDAFGIDGWNSHHTFVAWANTEGIRRYTPDWCLHVARCSKVQLQRFVEACGKDNRLVDIDSIQRAMAPLEGDSFVLCVLEF